MKILLLASCILCVGEIAYLSSCETQGEIEWVQQEGCYSLKDFNKEDCK